jgi:hypothetical protein
MLGTRLRAAALGLLLCGSARAEQGLFTALAGAGPGLQLGAPGAATGPVTLLLESNLGLSDRVNWEAPLFLELGGPAAVRVGTGVEYVYVNTNHWRLDVGIGLSARRLLFQPDRWRLAPYATGSVRWLFAWGLGAALGLHVAAPPNESQEPGLVVRGYPTLGLYQEFW